jgi:hypothetical protein
MESLRALRPVRWGSVHVEPFEAYRKRMRTRLPNFPEDQLESWLYRHFEDAVRVWGWLGFDRLEFERQVWSAKAVLEQVQAFEPRLIHGWKRGLLEDRMFRRSWLGAWMIEQGTWPVAPLVLDNDGRASTPKGKALARFHLIEGHHRLAYLHALAECSEWEPRAEHDLWITQIPKPPP